MAKENQQKENYRQHERETTPEKKIRRGQTVNTSRSIGKTDSHQCSRGHGAIKNKETFDRVAHRQNNKPPTKVTSTPDRKPSLKSLISEMGFHEKSPEYQACVKMLDAIRPKDRTDTTEPDKNLGYRYMIRNKHTKCGGKKRRFRGTSGKAE